MPIDKVSVQLQRRELTIRTSVEISKIKRPEILISQVPVEVYAFKYFLLTSKIKNCNLNSHVFRLPAPCPDHGRPYQGNRIGDDFRHGKQVIFTCPRDYIMEGVRAIICLDGRWSFRKPSCKGKFNFLF